MKELQQWYARCRAGLRRAAARVPVAHPSWQRPARLVLRLSESGPEAAVLDSGALDSGATLDVAPAQPLTLEQWRLQLVSAVRWLGPVQLTLISTGAQLHPLVPDLLRFAHRLDCRVGLVTDGAGVDAAVAEDLVDRGLAWVRVLVGGVSDGVHRGAVSSSVEDATGAVQVLVAARDARGSALDIEVGLPWQGHTDTEARAVIGWARQVGADGVRLVPPHTARDMPDDTGLLDELVAAPRPFNRTPSHAARALHAMIAHPDGQPGVARANLVSSRRLVRCPVGGQRLEISASGRVSCCPFKAPIGRVDDTAPQGELPQLWARASDHLRDIRSCDRVCAHPELACEPVIRSRGA